ncbi:MULTISPECIES: bifunctional NAD(P)/FAD-dependent oxidoreductase/class I SAM-dependent methyltransferase [unclassified Leucobacter]|uniref:bifunctional NAD(P)/FAD-dependent oxidoreductase/class I SAM-dependent methyltransferase n=1 Tax=unclassified Leucobacter TaxID=2621730 RepID=UPI00165E5AF8|nr:MULTISPECIES: bifunctional NAD(P)/FAD-dependent oxidoreductase/class I SAM-dependent methyltransferase [unclassified Leucobacter]MBC9927447.1 NAD(P)/FAD-dependent oxidoreductase [Leucobacter sp. cx-169]
MTQQTWDAIVIGGGAAGLSAAQTLGRSLRKTLVIDAGDPRNRFTAHVHNVLGLDGKTPEELGEIGRAEAARYGVEFRSGLVQTVTETPDGLRVTLEGEASEALDTRALIVATGLTDVLPDIPGLAERWGQSVLHCPYCHGWEARGGRIGIVTTSPMGMHQAKLLRQWSDDVTVFSAGLGEIDAETARGFAARGVTLVTDPVVRIEGEGTQVSAVVTGRGGAYPVDAVFVTSAMQPRDEFLADFGLERNDLPWGNFLVVDAMGQTSDPRIWAAGNVVHGPAVVPVAMGAGVMAAAAANFALVEEDYARAVAEEAAPAPAPAQAQGHGHGQGHRHGEIEQDPVAFWENHYGGAGPVWSGKVNATLAAVVAELAPGRSLDLGSGEGGDALWLAQRGWQATGVDISATAVARANEAAAAAGLSENRARFVVADLATLGDRELAELGLTGMDLVSASFFQSPVELPRATILRAAARLVAPGGHLVLVSHAAAPSWVTFEPGAEPVFPSPESELRDLGIAPGGEHAQEWETLRAEVVQREILDPEGRPATIGDSLVVLRRIA